MRDCHWETLIVLPFLHEGKFDVFNVTMVHILYLNCCSPYRLSQSMLQIIIRQAKSTILHFQSINTQQIIVTLFRCKIPKHGRSNRCMHMKAILDTTCHIHYKTWKLLIIVSCYAAWNVIVSSQMNTTYLGLHLRDCLVTPVNHI